jgi:Phage P22-like portal protein
LPKTVQNPDEFLQKARERYARSEEAEKVIRDAAQRDLRFLVGDQWDAADLAARTDAQGNRIRPALTMNKLPPFVNQITNEQRKNRPGAKISPQSGGADPATAEILEGLIRHIEYISQADVAYDTAFDYAVSSGYGFWRYVTEYVNERSNDQEIKVARIKDPSMVRMDTDAEEVDYSDAMWAFVWRRMSKEEFKRCYPDSETAQTNFAPIGGFQAPAWLIGDDCLVAEYWQVELEKKQLLQYRGIPAPPEDPKASPTYDQGAPAAMPVNGAPAAPLNGLANGLPSPPVTPARAYDADEDGYVTRGFFEDEDPPDEFEPDIDDDGVHIGREVETRTVWRYDINGHEILGKPKPWAGKYIPIVPTFGQEKYVDGVRVLMSAIRFALDPQQLYNFYKTTEAEVIQITPKNPYVGMLGQFKTMATIWADINRVPRPYVEYDPVAVGGQLAPPPARQPYEPATQALTLGASAANEDIKATTGLFDPSRGQANPNADSGVAIGLLQQQGETSTWHFFDNFLRSMWHGYRILLDLIPRIYDAPRVVRIVRPNDAAELVQINRMFTGKDGKRLQYDFSLGQYAVAVSVQQGYDTRRQQNSAELAQLAKADPQSLPQWADLYVKQLDLGPLGDEIAERLTPPQYKKQEGQNPQQTAQAAQALSQQNQQLVAQVHALSQQLETKQYESQQKDAANERDNQTKTLIATMQEETKRQSDAIKLAIAEMQAKAQTGARLTSDMFAIQTEREAMAHERGMEAYRAAIAAHQGDAGIAPGMGQNGAPGADDTGGDQTGAPDQTGAQPGVQRVPNDQDLTALSQLSGAQPRTSGAPPPTPQGG